MVLHFGHVSKVGQCIAIDLKVVVVVNGGFGVPDDFMYHNCTPILKNL